MQDKAEAESKKRLIRSYNFVQQDTKPIYQRYK
jgi:hypothetical protein